MSNATDFTIRDLGPCRHPSPLEGLVRDDDESPNFVDHERILLDDRVSSLGTADFTSTLELAGPRRRLFFDPAATRMGIVTCGGLCPGLNDVIRALVLQGAWTYGVEKIFGFRYGYRGFIEAHGHEPIELTPEFVDHIHESGGSVLASSRGPQDTGAIVDRLQAMGIDILFTIGGDGTQRGSLEISNEVRRRGANIAVVGIPKTIDNDIQYIDRSFGYETAFSEAVRAIQVAHNEAKGVLHGVGLVKLMGRRSGFIAAQAAVASGNVDFCLIPEMPFGPEAHDTFHRSLITRLRRHRHAVVVVAEGFGQDLVQAEQAPDASGNASLADIGSYMARSIGQLLEKHEAQLPGAAIKYIDPSYLVRGIAATASDSAYCLQLAQHAVHAAMAGKTEMIVGMWHGRYVHVPISMAVSARKVVDLKGQLWLSVLESTSQPADLAE